jgi:hypothetical protein
VPVPASLVPLPALPRVPASTALPALEPELAPAIDPTSLTDSMLVTAGPEVLAPPFAGTGSLPPPVLLTPGAVPALEPPRLEFDPQCNNAPPATARRTVAFLALFEPLIWSLLR